MDKPCLYTCTSLFSLMNTSDSPTRWKSMRNWCTIPWHDLRPRTFVHQVLCPISTFMFPNLPATNWPICSLHGKTQFNLSCHHSKHRKWRWFEKTFITTDSIPLLKRGVVWFLKSVWIRNIFLGICPFHPSFQINSCHL